MYAKVFKSLWYGSLFGEAAAQSVFIFMLAHADREGHVEMVPEAIAGPLGLTLETVAAAIKMLEAADPRSRSPEDDGRRISPIDDRGWGWKVVNYGYYRALQDADTVLVQTRERVRKHREEMKRPVTNGNGQIRHAEVDADAEKATPLVTAVTVGGAILAREGLRATVAKSKALCAKAGELHAKARALRKEQEQAFGEYFWPPYPRKIGKDVALEAFCKVCVTDDDLTEILAGLEWYKHGEWVDRPMDKITHASTWLNQGRWKDAKQGAAGVLREAERSAVAEA